MKHDWFFLRQDTFKSCRTCGCVKNKKISNYKCQGGAKWKKREREKEKSRVARDKDPKKYYKKLAVAVSNWRKKNPLKVKAHRAVFVAVRSGALIPQLCFCGKKGEAHHPDYTKPLDVLWYCKPHHRMADRGEL